MSDTSKTILTVGRAMDVLTLFTERNESTLGVTEISKALGLSKAVVHRILSTLLEKDFIQIEAQTRRYALGPAALKLGLTYLDGIDVRRLAQPILHELVAATQETSTLSIRSGWTRVYIDQETPSTDIRMSVQLGHPYPLHAGSSSKALLAFLDPDEQEAYLSSGPLQRRTPSTITDPDELRTELRLVRERGYARSLGERQEDAASVAAPVFDHRGTPIAAVSVCGPLKRFEPKIDAAAQALLEAVRKLSAQLGHRENGTAPPIGR
ncbi:MULTISPECIES: IclR family transcriptional regulator [Micromonospora]|uniref:Glycerol operon regulatory protein n=1 Tax=Micromonospora yangpuensis TaxID=683228 RepID=A0A1C6UP70_9ACTN|nr:IclR family transcriptional regulator [Micromonospora yangpuensis]GGM08595.1 IclR family transcriptional regulator [Micromonospora yangpuensis]SCL55831.1 transcriptional regulator, IclR family [Micromonospora yangpuensis]